MFSLQSYYVSLHSEFSVVVSFTISTLKRCSVRLYLQLFVRELMSYLRYLCLLAYSGVQHILCCVFVCLRLGYTMLPVSLDCLYLIAPSSWTHYVASFSGLSIFDCPFVWIHYVASFSGMSIFDCPFVLDTLCCQFLWIVHIWLPLRRYSLTLIKYLLTKLLSCCSIS